ncbi:MAG: response regulator [bacterium]
MTQSAISILLVDDHQLFRDAIFSCLSQDHRINVVGQLDNGLDALLFIQQKSPDIVLLDISLIGMDGLETSRLISAAKLRTKIIILSMHNETQYIGTALSLNILGYILKQEAFKDLMKAIFSVMAGKRYYSPSLNISPDHEGQVSHPCFNQDPKLTKREKEIVTLVAKGLSNQEIAKLSFLSIKTVETHRSNVNRKLKTRNSADITRYAIRNGLITP